MLPCLYYPSASCEKTLCSHMMHEAKLVIVETLCFLGGKPARVDTVEDWSFSLLFTCLIIFCMTLALFTFVCRGSNHGACLFLHTFLPCSASAGSSGHRARTTAAAFCTTVREVFLAGPSSQSCPCNKVVAHQVPRPQDKRSALPSQRLPQVL